MEVNIVEEDQPRLLGFRRGEFDYLEVPSSSINNVLDGETLKPEFLKLGVTLHRAIEPALSYTFFNMDDPVVGGYAADKVALRRAIAMAYDRDAEIRLLRNKQGLLAAQLVPASVPGHDPARIPTYRFDPAGARALLTASATRCRRAAAIGRCRMGARWR